MRLIWVNDMTKETINMRIENKIDVMSTNIDRKIGNLHEKVNDTNIQVAKIETHLKDMNGTIKEQQIKCNKVSGTITDRIEENKKKVSWVEARVWMAIGAIGMLSVLTMTKTLGLW